MHLKKCEGMFIMKNAVDNCKQSFIKESQYIYRVQHRIMEGDCQYDHGPRLVKLSSFYIDIYPVTNQDFKKFIDETNYCPKDGRNFLKHWSGKSFPDELRNHPVVWISQKDAKAYAVWLGKRLPKDTEWQLASGGIEKLKWPWGHTYKKELCNSELNTTTAVDAYPLGVSPYDCFDMCGNTWEWVEDIIDDGQNIFTFIRGGSYYKAPNNWHAEGGPHSTDYHLKFQLLNEGMNRCETVGFRCVKEGEIND